jgi:uncharacterized phiE125 gp8 family phage protein
MPLILTTPPSAEPLSLAEAKAQLRIYHSDDDTFVSTLITTARRMIEQRYDLALMQQNWSLFLDQWPEAGIFNMPLQPLLSVVDIKTYSDDDTPTISMWPARRRAWFYAGAVCTCRLADA